MTRSAIVGAAVACLPVGGCLSSPGKGGDGDGDAGSGGGGGDAGTSEVCGTTRALRGDFEVEELDASQWYGEQFGMDGGVVELWATPETFALLGSKGMYRVAGGEVQVEFGYDAQRRRLRQPQPGARVIRSGASLSA